MLDSLFSDRVVEVVADVQLVPCLRPTEIHQQGTQVTLFDRRAKVRQVLHRGMAPAHFERKVKKVGRRHFRYMLQWHTSFSEHQQLEVSGVRQVHVDANTWTRWIELAAVASNEGNDETSKRCEEHVDQDWLDEMQVQTS